MSGIETKDKNVVQQLLLEKIDSGGIIYGPVFFRSRVRPVRSQQSLQKPRRRDTEATRNGIIFYKYEDQGIFQDSFA